MTDGTMGLSAADVAAVTRNNDDDWGGGCWWIWIILLAFLFPMMGGWNRGGVETGVHRTARENYSRCVFWRG